jgi:hypothetical protein
LAAFGSLKAGEMLKNRPNKPFGTILSTFLTFDRDLAQFYNFLGDFGLLFFSIRAFLKGCGYHFFGSINSDLLPTMVQCIQKVSLFPFQRVLISGNPCFTKRNYKMKERSCICCLRLQAEAHFSVSRGCHRKK